MEIVKLYITFVIAIILTFAPILVVIKYTPFGKAIHKTVINFFKGISSELKLTSMASKVPGVLCIVFICFLDNIWKRAPIIWGIVIGLALAITFFMIEYTQGLEKNKEK